VKTGAVTPADLARSVLAVPPLARHADLSLNTVANRALIRHLENGGVSTVTITATAPAGGTLANGQSVSVLLSGTGTGNTSRYTSTCTSPRARCSS